MNQKEEHFLEKGKKKPAIRLYHFTTESHYQSIAQNGITEGVVPRSITNYIQNCQWLTSNPDWYPAWAAGVSGLYTRTQVRITLHVRNRRKLVRWLDFCEKNVPLEMVKTLNLYDNPEDWYIYQGAIPVRWFIEVNFRKDFAINKP